MRVSSDMPDDVLVLHDVLEKIREVYGVPGSLPSREGVGLGLSLNLKNCGTALRFLQVHIEKCYPGAPITLTGDPRLMERDGKPTSQTTSALILHLDAAWCPVGISLVTKSPEREPRRCQHLLPQPAGK